MTLLVIIVIKVLLNYFTQMLLEHLSSESALYFAKGQS